jgi:hypothetical protein
MYGDAVVRKIKEHNGVKIILISAFDLDHTLVKRLEEKDYISIHIEKPIHLTNLIELVADPMS